ncbi:LysM domain receptor-like kinase 3-like protein [Drosera capensis]
MVRFNVYPEDNTPDGVSINVTVRCFCGDEDVSKEYGLFVTYPLRDGESLQSVAEAAGVAPQLLERYNVGVDFGGGGGTVVFVPGKDQNGVFPPLALSSGVAKKVAISVPVVAIFMILLLAIYIIVRRRNQVVIDENDLSKTSRTISVSVGASPLFPHVAVERSVEFTYKELAQATNNFSASNKIGEGGFGWVFFAELRGQKAAVKKMKMKASKSFLAELKILMNVNHMNLVHLIGFCIERSLILVYEFVDNGNLSQHLREPGRDPMPWSTRMQIALDSARGIQYIHEHTTPAYIHRDIKSDNILIDKNFRAKVADFGLTKLMELGSETLHTEHPAGTFGYMPTEYARYGSVSPKIDVYAFGVVLFELISARTALVEEIDETAGPQKLSTLVSLWLFPVVFDDALRRRNPAQDLSELVDPALGDDYPSESIYKMAMLARACTLDDPKLRPNMRAVYVALETLSTNAENCSTALFISDEVLKLLASEVPDLGSDVP